MSDGLDDWSGIGLFIAGMTHQGWDVQLTAYAARDWRANFYPVGIAPSIVAGSAGEPTRWRAFRKAAWDVRRAGKCGTESATRRRDALSTPPYCRTARRHCHLLR